MKTCPDSSRLVDLIDPANRDAEARAHVQGCPTCTAELRIVEALPEAFRADVPVPEDVFEAMLQAVDREPISSSVMALAMGSPAEMIISGGLGAATAVVIIVGGGMPEQTGPAPLLLYSLLMGIAAVLYELRLTRRELVEAK